VNKFLSSRSLSVLLFYKHTPKYYIIFGRFFAMPFLSHSCRTGKVCNEKTIGIPKIPNVTTNKYLQYDTSTIFFNMFHNYCTVLHV